MGNSLNDLTEVVYELAKHSTISFSLEGWPAAAVLISIPVTVVIVYAIRATA